MGNLKIPNSAVLSAKMFPEVHNKSECQINNNRRAEGYKRSVNECEPDIGSGKSKYFTQSGANSENTLLEVMA